MSAPAALNPPNDLSKARDFNSLLSTVGRDFAIDCDRVGVAAELLAEIVAERSEFGEFTLNEFIPLLERCAPGGPL